MNAVKKNKSSTQKEGVVEVGFSSNETRCEICVARVEGGEIGWLFDDVVVAITRARAIGGGVVQRNGREFV